MTLHTQTLSTTFTNNFCACQSSPFNNFRVIVLFSPSFDSVSELDFDGFVTVEFGENEDFAAALVSGSDVD